mmetsp:Transcript_28993/g.39826  ORF Transcript_28993/g.39826 Transcript_28993/m.39826 type:complete len:252 (-) Transcript_28993:91-846(-)
MKSLAANIVRTSVPSIYSIESAGVELNLSKFVPLSKTLFSSPVSFISPQILNFKLPTNGIPEFAFIGRSNVGKSSMISCLLGNKSLVRVSKEPGCTKSINYYGFLKEPSKLDNPRIYLVDLPGYGFAKVAKTEQQNWRDMILSYFSSRDFSVLRRVFVLIDSRHGLRPVDVEMMDYLNKAALPYQILLTKCDLTPPDILHESLRSVFQISNTKQGLTLLPMVHTINTVHPDGGIDALKLTIAEIVAQKWGQ